MQRCLIDPNDDTVLAMYQVMAHRAEMHERPWEYMWSLDELRVMLTGTSSGALCEVHGALDGGRVVGGAFVELPLLDNLDKAYAHVSVDPGFRRRGVGTALVDAVVARCDQEHRTTIIAASSYPFDRRDDHPYRLFAERNGFSLANTEIIRELTLPAPDEALASMADEAAPPHHGYRIETYVDQVPDVYVVSYCYLVNQLVLDAPQGDLDFEEEAMTPEVYSEGSARLKEAGRQRYSTLAIDAEGVVVAQTDLVVPGQDAHSVLQWGTLVRRDHRGHRLGAAVKVANLRALQADHPERTTVTTSNAEVNASMVGINDRLGFAPVAVCPSFQRKL